ncbi:MAG TPA: hypothetical protein VIU93_13800 [Gallionellaceae bacterium]
MKKLIISVVMGVLVAASAWAKEAPVDVNKSAKNASDGVGGAFSQVGKVIGPAVGKAEAGVRGKGKSGEKKSDKAGK